MSIQTSTAQKETKYINIGSLKFTGGELALTSALTIFGFIPAVALFASSVLEALGIL